MPRIKIDYIVSFSSEDKDNPANNLLAWEVSKKKWLCNEGEPSASVVFQLPKAVQIESINIGVQHTALVEVLVALSEKANEPFEVLVPKCVFVSAAESRKDEPVERVRSFSGEQLAAARHRRWDRVRVVCSQPYNKRTKYGLSFVHLYTPESALPPRLLTNATYSSDEDEFRPGELFARSRASAAQNPAAPSTTDAQIRQASSQVIKNTNDASAKLVKTPIAKHSSSQQQRSSQQRSSQQRSSEQRSSEQRSDRRNDNLLYTEDDRRPHDRIDKVVKAHQDRKSKEEQSSKRCSDGTSRDAKKMKVDDSKSNARREDAKRNLKIETNDVNKTKKNNTKPAASSEEEPARASSGPVLAGVVFSLSGYENPRRGRVRDAAVALGARYEPHALQRCTHLVCAFPNTPKLRELRQLSPSALAVRAEWVEHCSLVGSRLPEPPYAPGAPVPPPPDPPRTDPTPDPPPNNTDQPVPSTSRTSDHENEENDTDDEIKRMVRERALSGEGSDDTDSYWDGESSAAVAATDHGGDADHGGDTDYGGDTEPDEPPQTRSPTHVVPELFGGDTFVVDERLPAPQRAALTRYLRAYGALVLRLDEMDEESEAGFVVSEHEDVPLRAGNAVLVSPNWVWRCHRKRRRCAVGEQ